MEPNQSSENVSLRNSSRSTSSMLQFLLKNQLTIKEPQEKLKITELEKSSEKIPINVRAYIYSFIEFKILYKKISKLSKKEREVLLNSELVDQHKILNINLNL